MIFVISCICLLVLGCFAGDVLVGFYDSECGLFSNTIVIFQNTADIAAYSLVFEKAEGTPGVVGPSSEELGNGDEAAQVAASEAKSQQGNGAQNTTGIQRDALWVEATTTKANSRFDALYAEYKRQKEEGVKVTYFVLKVYGFLEHSSWLMFVTSWNFFCDSAERLFSDVPCLRGS